MKKMYVWEDVGEGLTGNWHSGGGTVVIADNLDVARQLLEKHGVSKGCEVFTNEPSYSAPVEAGEDKVFIFQDAGCC